MEHSRSLLASKALIDNLGVGVDTQVGVRRGVLARGRCVGSGTCCMAQPGGDTPLQSLHDCKLFRSRGYRSNWTDEG